MDGHGRKQQVPITRSFFEDFVMSDDLILRFLHLDQLAKLVRLAGFALAYDLRVRLKQAHKFLGKLGYASQYSRLGLPHHRAYLFAHNFQPFPKAMHGTTAGGHSFNLLQHSARIVENLPGQAQQLADTLVCASARLQSKRAAPEDPAIASDGPKLGCRSS